MNARQRARAALGVCLLAAALATGPGHAGAAPAQVPPLPQLQGNPTPGTDLFASVIAPLTGGKTRVCATSFLGITVRCVERVLVMPSALPSASGVTYADWIFCRTVCTGSLLVHELVHVAQFERYGDLFGPMYLAEAAVHGTGCDNVYERPAYQTSGQCA